MSDGKFHQRVAEGTPGAVAREYTITDKDTKEETTHIKFELLKPEITGKITKVSTYGGQYGKNLILHMNVEGEEVSVSVSTLNKFGEDMLKKILAINLDIPVRLVPEIYKNKKGKDVFEVHVFQNGEKVRDYFTKYDKATSTFTSIDGFPPSPVKKGQTSKDVSSAKWVIFFAQVREFMIDTVEAHFGITGSDVDKKFNA